mgnify:CR=1 FL=1
MNDIERVNQALNCLGYGPFSEDDARQVATVLDEVRSEASRVCEDMAQQIVAVDPEMKRFGEVSSLQAAAHRIRMNK